MGDYADDSYDRDESFQEMEERGYDKIGEEIPYDEDLTDIEIDN